MRDSFLWSLGGASDDSDLDEQAGDEVRAHRRPYRLHSRVELLRVDGVERGEVSEVNEVNKARNDVVERCSGSLEHGLDVVEGLLGLLDQIVADHLARVRIEAALAGQEDPLTHRQPRRIGPGGSRNLVGANQSFHGSKPPSAWSLVSLSSPVPAAALHPRPLDICAMSNRFLATA